MRMSYGSVPHRVLNVVTADRDIEAGTESQKRGSVGDVFKMFRDQRESVY